MGADTIRINDYSAGKEGTLAHLKGHSNFHEIKCDMTNMDEVELTFSGYEAQFFLILALDNSLKCMKILKTHFFMTFTILQLILKFHSQYSNSVIEFSRIIRGCK